MPEVRITKPMWIDGKTVQVDSVVDLPEADAAYQVALGRAERIDGVVTAPAVDKATKGKKK